MDKAKIGSVRLRKGFWVETAPNGEKLYCHNARIDGKKIAIKKTVKDIERDIKEAG